MDSIAIALVLDSVTAFSRAAALLDLIRMEQIKKGKAGIKSVGAKQVLELEM